MTEDELKKKWCPFARVMNINGDGGGNRWDNSAAPAASPNGSLCIGSECAAHRVSHGWSKDKGTGQNGPVELDHYCGLAGRP